jgi:hypothetical protein
MNYDTLTTATIHPRSIKSLEGTWKSSMYKLGKEYPVYGNFGLEFEKGNTAIFMKTYTGEHRNGERVKVKMEYVQDVVRVYEASLNFLKQG